MKILNFFLSIFHFAIITLLLGTAFNSIVTPKIFPYLNLLSLAFPVLMIVHILLCIFWIFNWKKRAYLFLLASVFLFNPTRRWINFSTKKKEVPNLKILSFNTQKGYNFLPEIAKYIREANPDIALLQEIGRDSNLKVYNNELTQFPILFFGTNYKIINSGQVDNSGSNGNCIFADVEIRGKIIRLVNVYLSPYAFDKEKVKPDESLDDNKVKAKYVFKKLMPTFKIHQNEVDKISEFVKSSPYPIILCGDFNSVPNSYEYFKLSNNLKDVFVEVGSGSSTSFHDYKFPIRIDYVLCSKELKPVSYKVDRSVHISDHFPVITEFEIN